MTAPERCDDCGGRITTRPDGTVTEMHAFDCVVFCAAGVCFHEECPEEEVVGA